MRTRTRLVGATAVALALVLSACGGGDDEADETTTTTEAEETTTTTEAETTTTTEAEETTTTVADGPAEEALLAVLEPLLLTAEDVSPELAAAERPETDNPPPCGLDPDDDQPPAAKTGVLIGSDDLGLYLVQDLRAYATVNQAQAAFELAQEAFGCGADTDTEGVFLDEIIDVGDDVGTDAFAVEAEVDGDQIGIVVALYSDLIATFQFQGDPDAASAAGVADALTIAAGGVDKIITGLE